MLDVPLDRRQLAERNRRLTDYQHRLKWSETVRRQLLIAFSALPAPRLEKPIANTFLIIRPDHLGDNLLTTPSVTALADAMPDARLIGLTGDWAAPVLAAYPQIERVLTLPFPGFTRAPKGSIWQPYAMALQWAQRVRTLRAEVALIMRPDHWWGALLAYLAGIPVRVGYDLLDVAPFLTRPLPFARGHVVRQCLRLVEAWTGVVPDHDVRYAFPQDADDHAAIRSMLDSRGLTSAMPFFVIHAGAGTPIKRWDAAQWAFVADQLADRLGARAIFTGSDSEQTQITDVLAHMAHPGVSLAGDTNVGQLAALYAQAQIVLGSDSGPLHLAVASGAPTVHLYGPADPDEFGPWGDPRRQITLTSNIGCQPCRILDWPGDDPRNHPCIHDITPRRVVDAALRAVKYR